MDTADKYGRAFLFLYQGAYSQIHTSPPNPGHNK